jgi:PHD/YefM family antitoxin component YafN of YafNO toxin-antitoxin module
MTKKNWSIAEAQQSLEKIIEAALSGNAQVIQTENGEEVVLVSRTRKADSSLQPNDNVVNRAVGESEEDEFDRAMKTVREGPLHLGDAGPKGPGVK